MSTRADLNNNPTNIKVPSGGIAEAQQRYGDPGATVDPTPALDGGSFIKFSSPEAGANATTTLLKSPVYSGLTVDAAMKKWSGGGYGGNISPSLADKNISDLNPDELNSLTSNMAHREGYTGTMNNNSQQNPTPTQSKPQLTRDQMSANINAMEQQGASHQEVQDYLDGLKQPDQTSGQSTPSQQAAPSVTQTPQSQQTQTPSQSQQAPTLFGSQTLGDVGVGFGRAAVDTVDSASQFGDWVARNTVGRALNGGNVPAPSNSLAQAVGGQDNLTQLQTPQNNTQAISQSVGDVVLPAAVGMAGEGLMSGIFGSASEGTALGSSRIQNILSSDLGPGESLNSLSSADKANILNNALKNADAGVKPTIQKALDELSPKILREDGVGPGLLKRMFSAIANHPIASTAGTIIGFEGITPAVKSAVIGLYDQYIGSEVAGPNPNNTTTYN